MQLLYYWQAPIKERNLESSLDQGRNLGGPYTFELSQESSGWLVLSAKKNVNHMPGFFSNKEGTGELINVTAIIGKNGSGKTRFIDAMIESLLTMKVNSRHYIVVLLEYGALIVKHNLNYELYLNGLDELGINATFISDRKLSKRRLQRDELSVVHFSNIFDMANKPWTNVNPRDLESEGLIDLSTNYLTRYSEGLMSPREEKRGGSQLGEMKAADLRRQIKFIADVRKTERYVDFQLPTRIRVVPVGRDLDWACGEFDEQTKELLMPTLRELDHFFDLWMDPQINDARKSIVNLGRRLFARTMLYAFVRQLNDFFLRRASQQDRTVLASFLKSACERKERTPITIVSEWLKETSYYFLHEYSQSKDQYHRTLNMFTDRMIDLLNFIENNEKYVREDHLSIPTRVFDQFWQPYSYFYDTFPFLDISWRNMSSGENALLNMFGRLHSVKNQLANKNCIVVIDEGDLYLHPQWQKKYIRMMIDFLTETFQDSRIQLILTSHSPILLSDLPSNNVILLGTTTEKEETFAANIHSLFRRTFFIEDGLIGDFAKDKINGIIRDLIADNKEVIKLARQLNGQIGEPVIQRKLEQLIAEKSKPTLNDKIEEAQRRLESLIKQKREEEKNRDLD